VDGFGSVSEQSVHEVVSGIRDAVNRAIDVLILLLIVPKFFYTQTASVKFTTYIYIQSSLKVRLPA
jgi:hypothetical protein